MLKHHLHQPTMITCISTPPLHHLSIITTLLLLHLNPLLQSSQLKLYTHSVLHPHHCFTPHPPQPLPHTHPLITHATIINSTNNRNTSPTSPFINIHTKQHQRNQPFRTSPTLSLTAENVDKILDEVRPYLIADGGNCTLQRIQQNVVYIKLEGACGNCPASTVTVKMGIERKLKEMIPEVDRVEPVTDIAGGNALTVEDVEAVLDTMRPFLKITGMDLQLKHLYAPVEGVAASITLKVYSKSGAALPHAVKLEITQRLKKAFLTLTDIRFENDV